MYYDVILLNSNDVSDQIGMKILVGIAFVVIIAVISGAREKSALAKKERKAVLTKNPDELHEIGLAFYKEGNLDKAILYFSKALEINPRHFQSKKDKMVLLNSQKRYFEAKSLMEFFLSPSDGNSYQIREEFQGQLDNPTKAHILYFYGYVQKSEGNFLVSDNLKAKSLDYMPNEKTSLY